MIDRWVPNKEAWPEGALEALAQWEQGDLVADPPFFYFADPSDPIWEATRSYTADSTGPEVILPSAEFLPPYGLITSQTCDIGEEDSKRPIRPWVQISPVYQVTDWKRSKLEGGKGPKYWLLLTDMPEDGVWVVDFRIEVPVEKSWLAKQSRIQAFADKNEQRAVGRRLSFLRGRPAFSRSLNAVHTSLFDAFRDLQRDDADLHALLMQHLEEIVVQVDSPLEPTSAQIIFLTSASMPGQCREWLEQWRDAAAEALSDSGLSLLALDFRAFAAVTLPEYRRMIQIW